MKQVDNRIGIVRPPVHPSVRRALSQGNYHQFLRKGPLPVNGHCLCVCNHWAYADNPVDAINLHVIVFFNWYSSSRVMTVSSKGYSIWDPDGGAEWKISRTPPHIFLFFRRPPPPHIFYFFRRPPLTYSIFGDPPPPHILIFSRTPPHIF